jgi:hypothetical protein
VAGYVIIRDGIIRKLLENSEINRPNFGVFFQASFRQKSQVLLINGILNMCT